MQLTTYPQPYLFLTLFSILGSFFISIFSYLHFRHQYCVLTQAICSDLDNIITNAYSTSLQGTNLETQSSKIRAKLEAIVSLAQHSLKESSQRLTEVQQIVSDISHQLKTPLSNILLCSDTLEACKELDEDGQHFLHAMQSQIHKLEFLVHSLIKMSRLESRMLDLHTNPALLFPVLSKAVSAILPAAGHKGLTVEAHCPKQLRVRFDPKWTEEAIFNVLDNAVKYTPCGGTITIHAEHWQLYTRIRVIDTGIGIEPAHQNDIFKRFYRECRAHKEEGVGIGLYLTREILERQGGYITVDSALGKGSCFSLFLPNER